MADTPSLTPQIQDPCSLAAMLRTCRVCEDRRTSQVQLVYLGWGGGRPAGGQREVQNPRGADVGGVSGEVPADLSPATPEGWSQASLREQAQRHKSMGSAAKCVGGRRQAGGKAAQATL